ILDDISEKNDLKYEVTGELIVSSRNLAKQQRTVSGTVTTETGEPLAGVSVNIKGTQLSTPTDANGHFSLSLAEGSGTLVFSSVGYITQEIDIREQPSVRVVLEQEEKTLNEIVVVGYGTQKKSVVT